MAGEWGFSRGGRMGKQNGAKAGGWEDLASSGDALAKGVQVTIGCGEC